MVTLPVSDYTQIAKEYVLPNQKQSLWEQFLTGTQSYFEQAGQQVQDVYSYDISQAYANYKKQQLQLQMNEQLGAGFQQQVGSQLQTGYGSAFQDIKTEEASALADVQEQYQAAYEEGESRFTQFGETGKQLEQAIYEFAATDKGLADIYGTNFSYENALKQRRAGGLQFYEQTKDASGNITTQLTEYGKDFYNKVLHGTENRFVEFLQGSDEYEGLYDLYMENPDLYNYMVGGLEYGTREYDTTRMTKLSAQEAAQTYENIMKTNADLTSLERVYGKNFSGLTGEQSFELERNINRTSDYVATISSNVKGSKGKIITDTLGNEWKTVGDYMKTGGLSNDYGAKVLGKRLGIIDSDGDIVKSKYKDNDVIYYDGKYYFLNIDFKNVNTFGIREIVPA